jgi:hypothetical protein
MDYWCGLRELDEVPHFKDGVALRCFVSSDLIRLKDIIGVMVNSSLQNVNTKVMRNRGM